MPEIDMAVLKALPSSYVGRASLAEDAARVSKIGVEAILEIWHRLAADGLIVLDSPHDGPIAMAWRTSKGDALLGFGVTVTQSGAEYEVEGPSPPLCGGDDESEFEIVFSKEEAHVAAKKMAATYRNCAIFWRAI